MSGPTPSQVTVPTAATNQAEMDCVTVVTSAGTVQREVVSIADAANASQYAGVDAQGNIQTKIGRVAASSYSLAAVNVNASGQTALVASSMGKAVKVYKILLVIGGISNLTIQDGSTGLTGPMPFNAGGLLELDSTNGEPFFTTTAGNALNLNCSAGVQVSGTVWYVQE